MPVADPQMPVADPRGLAAVLTSLFCPGPASATASMKMVEEEKGVNQQMKNVPNTMKINFKNLITTAYVILMYIIK